MLARFRAGLSFANVASLAALFIALGGTAYAVTELDRNSVKSKHIVNGAVKGVDVDEASLDAVPEAALGGIGRTSPKGGLCNPNPGLTLCQERSIKLQKRGRVLVIASGTALPEDSSPAVGRCHIEGPGGKLQGTDTEVGVHGVETDNMSLVGVTQPLARGEQVFYVACVETIGNITFHEFGITVVGLSSE